MKKLKIKLSHSISIILILGAIIFFVLKNKNTQTIHPKYREVIELYSKNESDSLKLKAALFLIENMNEFTSSKTNNSVFYNNFASQMKKLNDSLSSMPIEKRDHILKNNYSENIQAIWDTLIETHGKSSKRVGKQFDTEVVTASSLIENIESAFDVWNAPWARDLTFEEFSEFILPYRSFGDPPVENWRQKYSEKYRWVIDSMNGSKDRIKAGSLINDDLRSWSIFSRFYGKYPGGQSAHHLLESKTGKCVDQTNLAIYAMRSVGVPVTMDFTPVYANSRSGHTWNALLLENGKTVNFQGAAPNGTIGQHGFWLKLSKVYRKTFAENKESLANKISDYKNIPPGFFSKHFIDVTADYSDHVISKPVEIDIKESSNKNNEKYAYLCTFNNTTWKAVDWSEIKNSKVNFKNIGVDIVYLLSYYNNGKYIPVKNPFILQKNGKLKFLDPKETTENINIERKYPLRGPMKERTEYLKKGIFQGANNSDFSDAENLYIIDEFEEVKPFFVKKEITRKKKFRYVRFVLNNQTEIAEIAFYANDKKSKTERVLSGNILSSLETDNELISRMFDNKTENYFSYPDKPNVWYGLDLQEKQVISHIGYCPRNDSNNIEPNNDYELMYWDKKWVSLGKKKSNSYHLNYENVPKNSLLLLRNLTKGKEERIFTYTNGKQVWW